MAAIDEALESPEFRTTLSRAILRRLQDIVPNHVEEAPAVAETVVDENTNYTAEGLAFHFRSRLARRPNAQEELESVTGFMQELIGAGIKGHTIYEALKNRGKSTEPIWAFCARMHAAHKATHENPYAKLQAAAEAELRRRGV